MSGELMNIASFVHMNMHQHVNNVKYISWVREVGLLHADLSTLES